MPAKISLLLSFFLFSILHAAPKPCSHYLADNIVERPLIWDPRSSVDEKTETETHLISTKTIKTHTRDIEVENKKTQKKSSYKVTWEGLEKAETANTFRGIARIFRNSTPTNLNTNNKAELLNTWTAIQHIFSDTRIGKIKIKIGFNDESSQKSETTKDAVKFYESLGFKKADDPTEYEIDRQSLVSLDTLKN